MIASAALFGGIQPSYNKVSEFASQALCARDARRWNLFEEMRWASGVRRSIFGVGFPFLLLLNTIPDTMMNVQPPRKPLKSGSMNLKMMERATRFELATACLGSKNSTTELRPLALREI